MAIPEMHPRKHKNVMNARTSSHGNVPSIASFNISGTESPIKRKNTNELIYAERRSEKENGEEEEERIPNGSFWF